MRYASAISDVAPQPQPQVEPQPQGARSFALFLLFFAVHFAIVSLLTILVLREVTASGAPPRWSLSREFPLGWSAVTQTWSALNTPTHWLDAIVRAGDVPLYRWNETTRVLLQCAFCGLIWGMVTFVVYLLGRVLLYETRKSDSTPEAPAMIPSESQAVPSSN